MKLSRLFALLMVMVMAFSAVAFADSQEGPIYDEWSDMTDEELYQLALAEGGQIVVYATSSKMLKTESGFEEAFPGLDLVVQDMDQDEVLSKCKLEAQTGNIASDVLQAKDVNGDVFYDFYDAGYCSAYYPKDIASHISEDAMKYGFPLYQSLSTWYYNTAAFPDGQPITSWWNLVEKNEDGTQKYRIFCKEIGQETAYLSLFASFILNADEMEQAYEELYGEPLEYTYTQIPGVEFEIPENNAGVEYLYRFTQLKMTFISDGDELVQAVHNSTAEDPALALASAGKITNRDESGYNIAWCKMLTPYSSLRNTEYMYVTEGCDNPAGARLFIRYVLGGADGASGGFKPFTKEGNWPVRDDVKDKKNEYTLTELGAIESDLEGIYDLFMDAQDMWIYWLSLNPNM